MSSVIDIAICFDRQIQHAALVLLASLKAQAEPSRPLRVHAITDGVSEEVQQLFEAMRSDAFSVVLMRVENAYAAMQSRGYISVGTYLRFMLPELLSECAKVVYLDIDVIVRRKLAPLYDVDVSHHALAAVPDFSQINSGLTWRPWRIGYEGGEYTFADYTRTVLAVDVKGRRPYFNAGVLVLNLDIWRSSRLVDRTLDYLNLKPNLRFIDQDALNHVVGRDYVRLDLRWNAFAVHACPIRMNPIDRWRPSGLEWQAIRAMWQADPWIIHYAGANKPWSPTDLATQFDRLWWDTARTLPNFAKIKASYIAACRQAGTGFEKCILWTVADRR